MKRNEKVELAYASILLVLGPEPAYSYRYRDIAAKHVQWSNELGRLIARYRVKGVPVTFQGYKRWYAHVKKGERSEQ